MPESSNLLLSFHLPQTLTAAPLHSLAVQQSYVSDPGDHTRDSSPDTFTATLTTWPLLTGVDVSGGPGSVVVLGDSITDGEKSTAGANHRWPDLLAARLLHQHAVPRYGVLNAGISANRVVSDRYPGDGVSTDVGGVSSVHRLDRDVLAQTSARTVLVFQGVNDVRWGGAADQVISGLREIAARAHAQGLRAVAATIAPCEGESRAPRRPTPSAPPSTPTSARASTSTPSSTSTASCAIRPTRPGWRPASTAATICTPARPGTRHSRTRWTWGCWCRERRCRGAGPGGYTSRSTTTGAWSEAPLPLRSSRST